ncbi:MAG: GNAT family N-acetyltransferase [Lunatimonas sp.]|uniref:GNAT family N-acetyltransferase n=1 Tax=Lunatimonas sp. TaxID=2060141 RepID=UPI00263BAAF9|nr:GNAT family N-acetyltransferase [Lunatimonas sp.]MCC5938096.1 GNAT family N-acetyltransferase [Lunatimonas sp.]
MQDPSVSILPYSESDRTQILEVWEKSVLATHHFLMPADFAEIKALVLSMDFNDFEVYCLKVLPSGELAGFIGVADRKIEMLFFSPEYIGKGLGRKLVDFALTTLKATQVDVNEQNGLAVAFYEKLGFKAYERTEKDDQGKNYPLLRMKLNMG